jgi:flagellar hook-basal body complex protein FliE
MTINSASAAAAAYKNTVRAALPQGGGQLARPGGGEPTFASLVQSAAQGAVDTSYAAERQALRAVATGRAELHEVVTAVANAEVTLQTVVAVRDRVIGAYQDIMRMPI